MPRPDRQRVLRAMSSTAWDVSNRVLYDLCREHPAHRTVVKYLPRCCSSVGSTQQQSNGVAPETTTTKTIISTLTELPRPFGNQLSMTGCIKPEPPHRQLQTGCKRWSKFTGESQACSARSQILRSDHSRRSTFTSTCLACSSSLTPGLLRPCANSLMSCRALVGRKGTETTSTESLLRKQLPWCSSANVSTVYLCCLGKSTICSSKSTSEA